MSAVCVRLFYIRTSILYLCVCVCVRLLPCPRLVGGYLCIHYTPLSIIQRMIYDQSLFSRAYICFLQISHYFYYLYLILLRSSFLVFTSPFAPSIFVVYFYRHYVSFNMCTSIFTSYSWNICNNMVHIYFSMEFRCDTNICT